jgi:TonB family protein
LREATDDGGTPAALAVGGRELTSIAIAAFQSRVGQASGRVHRAHDAQDGSDVWRTDPVSALFHREDRRPLKLATMGALAFHFALFLVVFPRTATPDLVTPDPGITVIRTAPLPPPPEIDDPIPVRKDAPPLPFPDPTPNDPEPLVARAAVYRYDIPSAPASVDFEAGLPVQPPPPTRERVRAGVDVQLPQLLERFEPEYPELAVRARHECVVVLEAVIGRTGRVIDAKVLRGCRLGLDESAIAAVQQWQFTPPTLNGRPVEVIGTFTVRFRLR